LLLIMPTLLMFLVLTSQAGGQTRAAAQRNHSHQYADSQSAWFVNADGDIQYDYDHGRSNSYSHHRPVRTKEEEAESWWYFVGFSCLIMGVAHGKGTVFHIGGGIMLATAARGSYTTEHNTSGALFLGALSFASFWIAIRLGCVAPAQERREQEENTTRAIDQGLKTIIYRSKCTDAPVNAALGKMEAKPDADDARSFLGRATNSAKQQYARVVSGVWQPDDEEQAVDNLDSLECGMCADQEQEQQEEEEEEECPICLEAFKDGEELAASGCGHYFHPACVEQWVQVDSSEHASQMRCPVCRFDVLEGIGAPTPAQIKHMRPGAAADAAAAAAAAAAVPTLEPIDNDLVEVDLEAGGVDSSSTTGLENASIWQRMRTSLQSVSFVGNRAAAGTMQPDLQRAVLPAAGNVNAL